MVFDDSKVYLDFCSSCDLLWRQERFDEGTRTTDGEEFETLEPIAIRHRRVGFYPMEDLHQVFERDTSLLNPVQ